MNDGIAVSFVVGVVIGILVGVSAGITIALIQINRRTKKDRKTTDHYWGNSN